MTGAENYPVPLGQIVLAFFRVSPLFLVSPILHFSRAPLLIRLTFTLMVAVMLGLQPAVNTLQSFSLLQLLKEALLGAALAFGFHAAAGALVSIGRLLDMQLGLNASGIFNPATQQSEGLSGELLLTALALVFVAGNFHAPLLMGLVSIIHLVPLGQAELPLYTLVIQQFSVLFAAAFSFSAPVMILLWLCDMAFALVSRSMPQANIYFVALPVKIAIGFSALVYLIQFGLVAFQSYIQLIFKGWDSMFVGAGI